MTLLRRERIMTQMSNERESMVDRKVHYIDIDINDEEALNYVKDEFDSNTLTEDASEKNLNKEPIVSAECACAVNVIDTTSASTLKHLIKIINNA